MVLGNFADPVNEKLYMILATIFGIMIVLSMYNWKKLFTDPNRHNRESGLVEISKRVTKMIPVVKGIVFNETKESLEMDKKLSLMNIKIRWVDIQAVRYMTIIILSIGFLLCAALEYTNILLFTIMISTVLGALFAPTRIVRALHKWYVQMMISEIPTFLDTLLVALKAHSGVYDALKSSSDSVHFMRSYIIFIVNGWGRDNESVILQAAKMLEIEEFESLSHMLQRALTYDRQRALTYFEKHAIFLQKFMEIDSRIKQSQKSLTYIFAVLVPALPSVMFLVVPLVVRAVESLGSQY